MINRILSGCAAILLCVMSFACSGDRGPSTAGLVPSATRRSTANFVAAIRSALPQDWIVQEVREGEHPFYFAEGDGTQITFVSSHHKGSKVPFDGAVWIMPPDYVDSAAPRGPNNLFDGRSQTIPPALIGSVPEGKVYLWGQWSEWWPTMQADIIKTLAAHPAPGGFPPDGSPIILGAAEMYAQPPHEARMRLRGKEVELVVVVSIERDVPVVDIVNASGEVSSNPIRAHLVSVTSVAAELKKDRRYLIKGIIVDEGYGAYMIYTRDAEPVE
jgi:hypothetical protein